MASKTVLTLGATGSQFIGGEEDGLGTLLLQYVPGTLVATVTIKKRATVRNTLAASLPATVTTPYTKDSDQTLVAAGIALAAGIYRVDCTACDIEIAVTPYTSGTGTLYANRVKSS